jgi:hypothetical protein
VALKIKDLKEMNPWTRKSLDRMGMEGYSVSQVANRIQNVAKGIGREFSTKGGSVENSKYAGCNQSVELTELAGARPAAHL